MTVFSDSHKSNPPFTDYLDVTVFDILPGSGLENAGTSRDCTTITFPPMVHGLSIILTILRPVTMLGFYLSSLVYKGFEPL